VIREGLDIGVDHAQPGDRVLVNGFIGDHGAAILKARKDLALDTAIESDCRALNSLIEHLLAACPQVHCLRDATRGGIATVCNEFAQTSGVCLHLDEEAMPMRPEVKGVCEILGLDPLYLANEGKLVAVVPGKDAETALTAMRAHPDGQAAAIVGEVTDSPAGTVIMSTVFGGERIVDMLVGEQLPRIC
jgi:hydrogenase expression/formation protein HypE